MYDETQGHIYKVIHVLDQSSYNVLWENQGFHRN